MGIPDTANNQTNVNLPLLLVAPLDKNLTQVADFCVLPFDNKSLAWHMSLAQGLYCNAGVIEMTL